MSTKKNPLHQYTLVENNNPSTFDERMERLNAGDTLEENKPTKMTAEEFEKKFGFSPNITSNANGGRRRKQTKRRRSTKRRRGSKRSRRLKRRK